MRMCTSSVSPASDDRLYFRKRCSSDWLQTPNEKRRHDFKGTSRMLRCSFQYCTEARTSHRLAAGVLAAFLVVSLSNTEQVYFDRFRPPSTESSAIRKADMCITVVCTHFLNAMSTQPVDTDVPSFGKVLHYWVQLLLSMRGYIQSSTRNGCKRKLTVRRGKRIRGNKAA
jgi:hypothetical protein